MKRWLLTTAILIALTAFTEPARVAVEGFGFEVAEMQEDAVAFSNRSEPSRCQLFHLPSSDRFPGVASRRGAGSQ